MGLTTQRFDILSRIAVGNGTMVYRAVEKDTLRQVALKLLAAEADSDHRFDVPTLLAQTPTLKQIAGNHVCQLLDAYDDEDGPVLVYEYVNGTSGPEWPTQHKITAVHALDICAQMISALRSGERARTPHGDLKPGNLVFVETDDGRPFLFVLDWGLSEFRHGHTADSGPYLAPERLAGAPASHQADLFSAAAVLFHLFTGKVLAMGKDRDELMLGWSRARPEILAELRPDLPLKLVHWISGLLALDPQKRPASAVEAGTTLTTLNPPPPLAPPETIRPRPPVQKTAVRPVSGVAARPPAATQNPSGPRPVPSASGVPVPRAVPPRPVPLPTSAKRSNIALILILLTLATGAAAGGAWWFARHRNTVAKLVPASTSPSRTPSPSVTAPVSTPKPRALPENSAAVEAAQEKAPRKPDASALAKSSPANPKSPVDSSKPATPGSPAEDEHFIAIESFDYPKDGDFEGGGSGHGWATPWAGRGAEILAKSLTYPAHPVEGGSIVLPPTDADAGWSRTVGNLRRLARDSSRKSHWYFSALVQHTDGTPGPAGEVRLNPIDPSDPNNLIQIIVADDGPGLRISLSGGKGVVEVPDASKAVFLLCRIEINPKGRRWDVGAQLLVNPKTQSTSFGGAGQPIAASLQNVDLPEVLGLSIRKPRSSATTCLDEIRYGRHWEEMSFKPPQIDPPAEPKAAARK